MDILNFISWIKGGRQVTTVDPSKTLIPLGLKDSRREDGYLSGAISVEDFANSLGGGGIIEEDTGLGSARRIDAGNCARGNYSVALGQNNESIGFNSSTLSGLYNKANVCCSSANGIGNVVSVSNSSINAGLFNVIACDALDGSASGLNRIDIYAGLFYPSSCDVTSYFPAGSTISFQDPYTFPQNNCYDVEILGSSFSGGYTTVCVNPSITTTDSVYAIRTNCFTTYSSYRPNVIAGGAFNTIRDYANGATISGGYNNTTSFYGTIGGGNYNCTSGNTPTIAGGRANFAGQYAFVGGGFANDAFATGAVMGGGNNLSTGGCTTIGAGTQNTASGRLSSILGGRLNTSSGYFSSIAGGFSNTVSGSFSSILGGQSNTLTNENSFIVGSGITSDRSCTTFVNALSMKTAPTSAAGLPAGTIWVDTAAGNVLKMA